MRHYSNDESDKSIRNRNYYLNVYVLPLLLAGLICAGGYWAGKMKLIASNEVIAAYFLSLTPAMLLSTWLRSHWLKMPDGSWHNIKGISANPKLYFNEPSVYLAEYRYSKKDKAGNILIGAALIAGGVWFALNTKQFYLMLITSSVLGLSLFYKGLNELLDKSARLKIASNGLWTAKLGFVNWDDIHFAEVKETKDNDTPRTYLEIRLKGTKFDEGGYADERLLLSDLEDWESVEMVVNNSIINYNKAREENKA